MKAVVVTDEAGLRRRAHPSPVAHHPALPIGLISRVGAALRRQVFPRGGAMVLRAPTTGVNNLSRQERRPTTSPVLL